MILTFKQKIVIAFSGLCALVLLQSAAGYAFIERAQSFEKRSLTAQELLVAYTNIGADKQRLKVWYAELLLTGKASVGARDALIDRINLNIQTVRERLPIQHADITRSQVPAPLKDQFLLSTEVLDILEINFANFRNKVNQSDWEQSNINKKQVWTEMLNTFDVSGGRDVRVLIADAIAQQSQISLKATQDADRAIDLSKSMRLMMLFITVLTAISLAVYFVKHLTQPISDLMLGTQRIQSATINATDAVAVPIRSPDEFGTLARSFNAMSQEIFNKRNDEKTKKEELEQAVALRTAQLLSANEVLRTAEIRRREFFSDVSHELRTPATAILGEAEIALRGGEKTSEEYCLSLKNIANTTRQLSERINALLMLSRGQLLATELHFSKQSLLPIVEAALVQSRALAQDTGVTLQPCQHLMQKSDADSVFILTTDADKLNQLLMVFYDNAIRYTPAGGCIRTCLDVNQNKLQLRIEDTGVGIAANEKGELFQRHFRGTQARTMRSDGAGLGLAIAKTLAEALSFKIDIGDSIEGGCCITLEYQGI